MSTLVAKIRYKDAVSHKMLGTEIIVREIIVFYIYRRFYFINCVEKSNQLWLQYSQKTVT